MANWLEVKISGLLLDISGVLKNGNVPIDGSIEAFEKLKSSGIPFCLVTNETQATRSNLHCHLKDIGFELDEKNIFPPAPAMSLLLKIKNLRPHLLVHHNLLPEFKENDQTNPNCVVLGDAAEDFTYENVNKAFGALIKMKDPKFYTLGRGKYYKEGDNLMLDVGAYTAALEFASGISAELVGKPSRTFFKVALEHLGLSPENVVMIGDDILGDVGGAQSAGMRGVLVRTGKFRETDLEMNPSVVPNAVVDNLLEAVNLILNVYSK